MSEGDLGSGGAGRLEIGRRLAALGRIGLDALLPPRCLVCGSVVPEPGSLCAPCWESLDFIAPPLCQSCGTPFDYETDPGGPESLCGACHADPPAWDRARAVLRYDDASRRLVLAFKHGDRTEGAAAFGRWMARAAGPLLAEADIIAPVPLHWTRLFRRRYNQAALLAWALGKQGKSRVLPDLLLRRRRTPIQGRMTPAGRQRNVAAAFAVRSAHQPLVRDKRVLLVDDVLTSGATAGECARVLKRAGAAGVDLVTLTRVVLTR